MVENYSKNHAWIRKKGQMTADVLCKIFLVVRKVYRGNANDCKTKDSLTNFGII